MTGAPGQPSSYAELVAELALSYADVRDPDRLSLTEQIIAGAIETIPGVVAAAVETMDRDGLLTAPVMVGHDVARTVMDAQNRHRQGPCLDALRDHKQIVADDLADDVRWAFLVDDAARVGVRSMLCTPMEVSGRLVGVLSLLGGEVHFGDAEEDSAELARVFAAHAALALSGAAHTAGLNASISSRDVIGQAKGILMERFKLTPDKAFAVLVRTSSHTNTKLRVVCEQLCDTGRLDTDPSPRA